MKGRTCLTVTIAFLVGGFIGLPIAPSGAAESKKGPTPRVMEDSRKHPGSSDGATKQPDNGKKPGPSGTPGTDDQVTGRKSKHEDDKSSGSESGSPEKRFEPGSGGGGVTGAVGH